MTEHIVAPFYRQNVQSLESKFYKYPGKKVCVYPPLTLHVGVDRNDLTTKTLLTLHPMAETVIVHFIPGTPCLVWFFYKGMKVRGRQDGTKKEWRETEPSLQIRESISKEFIQTACCSGLALDPRCSDSKTFRWAELLSTAAALQLGVGKPHWAHSFSYQ